MGAARLTRTRRLLDWSYGDGVERQPPRAAYTPAACTHSFTPHCWLLFCADWSIEALTLGTVVTGHMSYPQVVRQLCGRGGALLLQLSLVFRCAGERLRGASGGFAALRVFSMQPL